MTNASLPGGFNVQDSFHIVLVEPADSRNIGAVARAMMNLGFRNIHLVAPQQYSREQAGITARHADVLLESMVVHETFAQAIADMDDVVGLALREGIQPAHHISLPDWADALPGRVLASPRRIALVFGREDNGLRNEHLVQCRNVIRIPSTEEFAAFNLAQSVLLVLYDITRVLTKASVKEAKQDTAPAPPPWNDYFQLDRHLDAVMTESGFVREGSPKPVPDLIKNLFRRLELTPQEMGVLLALFARLSTTLRRNKDT
jgi:TrmH family RNA methyltransferase